MAVELEARGCSPRSVTVLLSGGLDSAACLEFFHSQSFNVKALHVAYGQAASVNERLAANQLAKHYEIPLTICEWKSRCPKSSGEIVARNAFLLFAAAMEVTTSNCLLAIGVHSGTPYYDCSETFLNLAQQIVNGYVDGRIKIVAPFITWSKPDVWQFCISRGVPIDLTYSCELGSNPACGSCLSCLDRRALDAFKDIDNSAQGVGRHA